MPRKRLEPGNGRVTGRNLNATAYSHFIQALLERPRSRPDLIEITGLGEVLISKLLIALRARGKTGDGTGRFNAVLHIAEWRKDARGYPTVRAFALGPGVDAPQPVKSRAEVVRDYYERRRMKGLPGRVRNRATSNNTIGAST